METRIFNTVNCGVYFENGDTGIFVDGLFDGLIYGYSNTPGEILDACFHKTKPFENLKAFIFTHKHHDHFSEEMLDTVCRQNEDMLVFAPEYEKSNIKTKVIKDGIIYFEVGPFKIYAITTMHDGDASLRAEPHVSFVINTEEETFFFAGDALFRTGEPEKIENYCDHWVDMAFINPYHTMHGGNRALLRKMDPMRIALIHKPFKQDDTYNMHTLFDIAIKHYPEDLPELIQPEFNTWIQ